MQQHQVTRHNASLVHADSDDGVDRRGFLKCMAWEAGRTRLDQ